MTAVPGHQSGQVQYLDDDNRLMAAAIRFSFRNLGATGTNPSVATLIVRDDGQGPRIIGRGVTAVGGRPHAEAAALDEAGAEAKGATAYVTLEPCAHHGRTPPCAEALVSAGIARVVGAASDPDPRVSGEGYAILRNAGVSVTENILAVRAREAMAGYLSRTSNGRPFVTLKLAVSSDGKIGRAGAGQVTITGPVSRDQVHVMRAQSDAILIGVGTVLEDDPDLTCRLPGLEDRSPIRIVLDANGRMPADASMLSNSTRVSVLIAAAGTLPEERRRSYQNAGATLLASELAEGRIALPELLEDLAARGVQNLMIEGGAQVARSFLDEGLVDRIAMFSGTQPIGRHGIGSPVTNDTVPAGFVQTALLRYGEDRYCEWTRLA